jgi:hypothetical protein
LRHNIPDKSNENCVSTVTTISKQLGLLVSFKYLGAIVNEDNSIEEEVKERIAIENKAYYSNKSMFQSKLIFIGEKLKQYWSVVKPVITYACETWVLK